MPDQPATKNPPPQASGDPTLAPLAIPPPPGPPFGPAFFLTVLNERVRSACDANPEAVPVVELQLVGGGTFDVCHIPLIEIQWLAAQVYRDRETCEDMDLVFIPYHSIALVTVSMWHHRLRPVGFNLEAPPNAPSRRVRSDTQDG